MGSFILKRKIYSMPYDPKPRIQAIEGCPFVDEDYDTVNNRNIKVDEIAITNLFKNPVKYVTPEIYEYEKEFIQSQGLGLKDYEEISCCKVEVNDTRDIEFWVKPVVGSKLYRRYGPTFTWHLIGNLRGTRPQVDVFDGYGEL